jgi:2-polyprenyl-3-methyl-5-hydroxy-6-metoxy-1,4-benzoquinol methylase
MKEAYASVYRELHQKHWWWRARETVLLREIERAAPPSGWRRLLDVGCGDALFFDALARFGEVWGVESDPVVVRSDGPHRGRIHIGTLDASFTPDAPFGLILMLDVIEHIREPGLVLRRALELLEPSGAILVTVPAFPLIWTRHDDINEHVVRYTRASLAELVERSGLKVQSSRYLFHWLFPAKLATRALELVSAGSAKPASLPPAWVNRMLLQLSEFEEQALHRASLPFGSSLLAWLAPR